MGARANFRPYLVGGHERTFAVAVVRAWASFADAAGSGIEGRQEWTLAVAPVRSPPCGISSMNDVPAAGRNGTRPGPIVGV